MTPAKLTHCRASSRHNVLAAATTGFIDFLSKNGGAADKVCASVGLAEDQLHDINRPLDLGSYVRMMELAAVDTGNDNFGLWFGQQFKPEMLGLIGGIAIASPTLGAALSNLARLFPYHQQATHTAFRRHRGLLSLEYRIIDGGIVERRHDAELTLGMLVNVLRHCLGAQWAPAEVHFEHLKPADSREHAHAFLAPVHFGQRTNALLFRDDRLHQRMPHGDLHKANLLSEQLVRIGGGIGTLSLLDHVKGEIRSRLPGGVPLVGAVADAVGLQRWTLQRRLSEYGLSFSDLVDLVRRELAERHIRQRYVSALEMSDILGYSELSAFSRAFRRWFGISPQKFRARLFASEHVWH
jgi:AraC-like DNA-binding protein